VPDHSERVVGDGEDECGIRASGATTISKHQASIPRATARSITMTTMKDKMSTVGNIYYGRHGKNLAEVAVPNQSFAYVARAYRFKVIPVSISLLINHCIPLR
jgi:hypothetical protein